VPAAVAAAAHDTLVQLVPPAQHQRSRSTWRPCPPYRRGQPRTWASRLARRSPPRSWRAGVRTIFPPLNVVLLAGWSELPPFALETASQFRPPAPPSTKSITYATDFNEVRRKGSRDSAWRTAEQTDTALFWFTAAAKEWNVAAQTGLADAGPMSGGRRARWPCSTSRWPTQ
jgi:hypothetical protein